MLNFEAKTSTEDGRLVVSLSGECDLTVRAELAAVLARAVGRSAVVIVDLADLAFLDSSGIHELVTAYHAARDREGHLYLRKASGVVATVLELTGVDKLLGHPGDGDGPAEGATGE
jgi:anti-sigma B factor antagonist